MDTLQTFLAWADGKKTYFFAFLTLTNAFLGAQHAYSVEVTAYIQAVLALLAGGTEKATTYLGARK